MFSPVNQFDIDGLDTINRWNLPMDINISPRNKISIGSFTDEFDSHVESYHNT